MTRRPGRPSTPLPARFWALVDIGGADDCWLWMASRDPCGYGQFRLGSGLPMRKAHQVAWQLATGAQVPTGLVLDHLCRNRACCNPRHLEPVTSGTNSRRGLRGALTTRCPHGHPYDESNTYLTPAGARVCRACRRARARLRRRKDRERRC